MKKLTHCIHSQFVQKPGFCYTLKVGPTHHTVHPLLDKLGDTHALTDVKCQLSQIFIIYSRHGGETRAKPEEEKYT